MHGIFCLVFTASAKGRVELRAKNGQYRNRCFNTWCIYNVTCSSKSLEKNTIMRKLLPDPMVSSSSEWRGITPMYTTIQKHDKYGRESSVSEMRIWFISYLYRPGEWDGKEWAVQKINRENESHWQKNSGKKHTWISFQCKKKLRLNP